MTDTSPNLNFGYVAEGEPGGEVIHNDNMNILDALLQGGIISRTLTEPPSSPSNGDLYIVGDSATDEWDEEDGNLALFYDGWIFREPQAGCVLYDLDNEVVIVYTGSSWEVMHQSTRKIVVRIMSPAADDEFPLLAPMGVPYTIVSIGGVISGGTSCDIDVLSDEDRDEASPTTHGSESVTSTSSGTFNTSPSTPAVPAGNWLWGEVSAVSGSVDWIDVVVEVLM